MLNQLQRLLFVRKVPLFEELRDDFLIRLASVMEELDFPPNHVIFHKGEEGESLYIVVSGRVKVHIGDRTLSELDVGSCFGEMAVIDAEPRSASVTTLKSCECLLLTQRQLYEAIDEMPSIAVNLMRLLSRRIRTLNDSLNVLKEEQDTLSQALQAQHQAQQYTQHQSNGVMNRYGSIPSSPISLR